METPKSKMGLKYHCISQKMSPMEAPSVGHILSGGSSKNRAWVGAPILARAPGRRLPGRCTPRLPVPATTCRPAARPLGARPGLRVPPYRLRRPAASTACLCRSPQLGEEAASQWLPR
jgi:hypothetical protein